MSYVGGQIDELSMTDRETGKQFTISRKGWEEDVRYNAEGYVRVAGYLSGKLTVGLHSRGGSEATPSESEK